MAAAVAGTLTYKTELDTSGVQKAGSTIKSIIAGLGITKMISRAMSEINASIDGAISRFDTLNNFPKVMSNLGISSEKADKSIKKMSERLSGLPTTLDEGALAVQRFTSANGDVEKSTEIFLALNNAIIAGGAGTQIQASALEQLSQAYSKGKMDMMEWRTIQMAMPAQLNQIAKSLGITTEQLGINLREGKNTKEAMDEFMDAIVRLNTEGLEGFQNFEEQARNATGGIGTAITVAKTQIVKGVTDIIDALNIKLEDLGIGKLSDIIANLGKDAKKGLDTIAKLITGELSAVDFGKSVIDMITNFVNKFNEQAPTIIKTGLQLISDLIIGMAQGLPELIPAVVDTLITIAESLLDNIDIIIDAIISLAEGLADGVLNSLPIIIEKVPVLIEKLIDALTGENLEKLLNAGVEINLKLTEGLIKAIPELLKSVPRILKALVKGFISYHLNMAEVGANIIKSLGDGLKGSANQLGDKVSQFVTNTKEKVVQTIKELPQKIMEFINQIPYYIGYALGQAIATVINFGNDLKNFVTTTIPEFINSVIEWFKQLPEKIKTWLTETINKVIQWGIDLIIKGKNIAKELVNNIINGVKNLPNKMIEIGKNVVKGIWDGIKNMAGWLKQKTKDFAQGIVNGIKDKLKISSPSKVMIDLAQWIPKGIAVGIETNTDSVDDAINDMYNEMNKAIKLENSKMNFDVVSGDVYNKSFFQTPVAINVKADVEMDSQKVGRLVTPSVTRTIKNGGGI